MVSATVKASSYCTQFSRSCPFPRPIRILIFRHCIQACEPDTDGVQDMHLESEAGHCLATMTKEEESEG